MGSQAVPAEQKARYLALRRQGLSQSQAAAEAGISRTTGHRLDHDVPRTAKQLTSDVPPPLSFEELSKTGQEALRSFPFFAETFFCTRVAPWWSKTAEQVVADVLSSEQTFTILNLASGVGKTTLLTRLIGWLTAGGGSLDPAYGRALRVMYGSSTMDKAVQVVDQLRRTLEDPRPFYDFRQKKRAEHSLAGVYGRFKPLPGEGDDTSVWQRSQFTVAQLGDYGLFQKDPTLVAASIGATVMSSRIDVAVFDDPASFSNMLTPDLAERWETEVESRIEPEGSLFAVGQRLGVEDLYGTLLERTMTSEEGEDPAPFYRQIVFPSHNEPTCDAEQGGSHRQWNLGTEGCLLDEYRLPWPKLLREQAKSTWKAMYQQKPEDDASGLVPEVHIFGGTDATGFEAPGCLDRDRMFGEHPEEVGLIDYVTVDTAVSTTRFGGYWAIEWKAVDPQTRRDWLIEGHRLKMTGSDFIDFDPTAGLTGFMPTMQTASVERGHPIRVWVIEKNRAEFLSTRAVDLFRRTFGYVTILSPFTQRNKTDKQFGIEALLPGRYRNGERRLPYRGVQARDYLKVKIHELSRYPHVKTDDTVLSDWVGEANLDEILAAARPAQSPAAVSGAPLPGYLKRQQGEARTGQLQTQATSHQVAGVDGTVPCEICSGTGDLWTVDPESGNTVGEDCRSCSGKGSIILHALKGPPMDPVERAQREADERREIEQRDPYFHPQRPAGLFR